MRVCFHDRPVHECPRVTLVPVAYNKFQVRLDLQAQFPLFPCGKACTTSSPQSGICNHFYNLARTHLGKGICKCPITVHHYIIFDLLGINKTLVPQYQQDLMFEERYIFYVRNIRFFYRFFKQQLLVRSAFQEMFFDKIRNCFHLYFLIKDLFRIYCHDRSFRTKAVTTCRNYLYFILKPLFFQLFLKGRRYLRCSAGNATSACT